MRTQLRLLPILIITLAVACLLRLGDVWQGLEVIGATPAVAKSEAAKTPAKAKPAATKPAPEATKKADADARDETRIDPATLSASEVAVLQALSQRRAKLDTHRRELETREGVLKATETRIDEKITRLKKIEASIEALIEKQDAAREAKLKSLVKVYESMKPKDAARILDQLEMEVLLEVTGRMKESRMAAIMAKMTPTRAKELTVHLAKRPHLPDAES